ncbi:hypothetical protein [Cryobacterium sp. PH31-O1]|uniref:hypothetical protein n=1 Tax=Cryobacterium sp. PH31-O1 TaxID=3046306 RepID=UPI0024BBA1C6|nr:hypothetical protein [Cryobacterium sp. PH31-O1]MDJ0339059.1 hypothetical protein [Cryobacterium sp. PH31-O1]
MDPAVLRVPVKVFMVSPVNHVVKDLSALFIFVSAVYLWRLWDCVENFLRNTAGSPGEIISKPEIIHF